MTQSSIHADSLYSGPTETQQKHLIDHTLLRKSREQRVVTVDINADPEVVKRVKHTMLHDEALGSWYARVGMGRSQVLVSSHEDISKFVAQAMANLEDTEHAKYKKPRSILQKFFLD